jgi:hypothetical protein
LKSTLTAPDRRRFQPLRLLLQAVDKALVWPTKAPIQHFSLRILIWPAVFLFPISSSFFGIAPRTEQVLSNGHGIADCNKPFIPDVDAIANIYKISPEKVIKAIHQLVEDGWLTRPVKSS